VNYFLINNYNNFLINNYNNTQSEKLDKSFTWIAICLISSVQCTFSFSIKCVSFKFYDKSLCTKINSQRIQTRYLILTYLHTHYNRYKL